jgi:hypothetical protein
MYIEVKQLAPAIQSALASVRYGARDVEVEARDEISLRTGAGSAGARGFVTIVNLATGKFHTERGDWGGAGLGFKLADFTEEKLRLVDNDDAVVIQGSTGWPRTFAHVYASPNAVGRFLPSGEEEVLTPEEQQAIYCHAAIKGGQYRREELRRRNVSPSTVDSLVERGYLKRNRAGAVQITTKGKNARTVRN